MPEPINPNPEKPPVQMPPGELPPTPATPPTPPAIPKSKDEWDRLAQENPQRWISLTQSRMDQTVRQARETQEKLAQKEQESQNYQAELERLRNPTAPETPPYDVNKQFSRENMPQNQEQWDTLWIENPNLASDLRHFKNQQDFTRQQQTQAAQSEFAKSRRESAKTLWDRHPDMYVTEIDEQGNAKLDGNGKPILRLDPNTNAPMLNLESEKGKLFVQVYSEDPQGYDGAKHGPRLAMAEMERRLRDSGNQQVQNAGQPQQLGGQTPMLDQRGTMPGGVTPPATPKVSFSSDDEKAHAMRAVDRGTFKSLEEYCQLRDVKNIGIEEQDSVPNFSKI